MAIEEFNLYQVSDWCLEKLKNNYQLWSLFLMSKNILNLEDYNQIKQYFHCQQNPVLELETRENILRILMERKSDELSLERGWGLIYFYLTGSWEFYNQEWQNRNQFENCGNCLPLIYEHKKNNLLLVDSFTTGTYLPYDQYISYYTSNEVQQINQALITIFHEDFETRLDRIQELGQDVNIYRGNREYYFSFYFNDFAEFYQQAAKSKKSIILQAIC